ncbi:hypothetical protein D3C87_2092230 [compost metagenome]
MEQVEIFAGGQHQVQLLIPRIPRNVDFLHLNADTVRSQLLIDLLEHFLVVFRLCAGNQIFDFHRLCRLAVIPLFRG